MWFLSNLLFHSFLMRFKDNKIIFTVFQIDIILVSHVTVFKDDLFIFIWYLLVIFTRFIYLQIKYGPFCSSCFLLIHESCIFKFHTISYFLSDFMWWPFFFAELHFFFFCYWRGIFKPVNNPINKFEKKSNFVRISNDIAHMNVMITYKVHINFSVLWSFFMLQCICVQY